MAEIAGLKLIVPSSVTVSGATASVSASGKITFSGVTSANYVQVNGVFSSTYDNYLIVFAGQVTSGTGEANLFGLLSASGSASTTGYVSQYLYASSTTVSGRRDNPANLYSSMHIGQAADALPGGAHSYWYGPYLAQPTASRSVTVYGRNSATISDFACTHSASTSYDGFRVLCNALTIGGTLQIYGLSQ